MPASRSCPAANRAERPPQEWPTKTTGPRRRLGGGRRVVGDRAGEADQLAERQPEVMLRRGPGAAEQVGGGAGVAGNTGRLALAHLDARRGQLDESLEEVGGAAGAPAGVP